MAKIIQARVRIAVSVEIFCVDDFEIVRKDKQWIVNNNINEMNSRRLKYLLWIVTEYRCEF